MMPCMCGFRGGGRGSGLLMESHKVIVFFTITGTDPLENHKADKPEFMVLPSLARQEKYI